MLHNIKLKAICQKGCCYVAICLLYNKKLCYIAHPKLPDDGYLPVRRLRPFLRSICSPL